MSSAMRLWEGLVELLFPPPTACVVCSRPLALPGAMLLCAGCVGAIISEEQIVQCAWCRRPVAAPQPVKQHVLCRDCGRGTFPFKRVAAVGLYRSPLREAIHLFKFNDWQRLARDLGSLMARVAAQLDPAEVVVPVPLARRRLAERGYNQAGLLAGQVARQLGVVLEERALVRRGYRTAQSRLGARERRVNPAGSFALGRRGPRVHGRRVLLVDDVLTTGTTAALGAQVLLQAGAEQVNLVVLAVSDLEIPVWEGF